jgi:hypothetical protein
VVAEQLRQPHRLGALVGADPLEHIIFGQLAAGRERAALSGDRLELAAQRDLGVEQGVARGAIFGRLVRVSDVFHGGSPFYVTQAQAGVHSGFGARSDNVWTPACAGVTG